MGNRKLKIANTEADNLVSNLRGEIAEVLTTWVLMRRFLATAESLKSDDLPKDLRNPDLAFTYIIKDKLEDELIARLSELAEEKVGRLNFHFASEKLGEFRDEVVAFARYVEKNGFRQRRNQNISHKELPERWEDHRAPLEIPYRTLVRAVSHALRLMKRIDRRVLGPSAPYLWREARKRRYNPILSPPAAEFMLVPYLHLSGKGRIRIVREEEREVGHVWSEMSTTINGLPTEVLASRKWGVVMLGNQYLPLETYPLADLTSIELGPAWHPLYEEHTIQAQYKCKQLSKDKLSFEPVDREHRFPDGSSTELVDIHINLNDEIRKNLGTVGVGDIKDFSLNVRVLAGFEASSGSRRQGASPGQS